MNYLNVTVADLRRPEFASSELSHIATWLLLSAYCASVENGGIIEDCSEWNDRQWMSTGVMKSDVIDCPLFNYIGNDLHVLFYPLEQEATLRAKRKAGKKGGRPPKNKAKKPHGLQPDNQEVRNATNVKERKGKERKEKEGNSKSNSRFNKPTVEQIKEYGVGYKTGFNEEDKFFDFYESKNWMVGKNKMKCWKSAVRNWVRNKSYTNTPTHHTSSPVTSILD